MPSGILLSALGGRPAWTGRWMSPDVAQQCTAVYACIGVLAESLASLPLVLYRQEGNRKVKAIEHPLYSVLHDGWNFEQTSYEAREMLMGHLCLRGNAYCQIVRDNYFQVSQLVPLQPDWMIIKRQPTGQLLYEYRKPNGLPVNFQPGEILHLRLRSNDGMQGMSPITLQRETVALNMAYTEFAAKLFGSGARPSGILTYPGEVTKDQADRIKESWNQAYGALDNVHKVAVLEQGMTWQQMQITPEDAQYLESRKFSRSEIASIYRVPPHMIGDLERATHSNIEQQAIDFVQNTMLPWVIRWEQTLTRDLLTPAERRTYFLKFNLSALLRGDTATRYQAYVQARQNGWLNANEIRDLEDMDPIDGPAGEAYWMPVNVVVAGDAPGGVGAADAGDPNAGGAGGGSQSGSPRADKKDDADTAARALEPVVRDVFFRLQRRGLLAVQRNQPAETLLTELAESLEEWLAPAGSGLAGVLGLPEGTPGRALRQLSAEYMTAARIALKDGGPTELGRLFGLESEASRWTERFTAILEEIRDGRKKGDRAA